MVQGENKELRKVYQNHLYVIVNLEGYTRDIYDFVGVVAPTFEQAPYINIRFFDKSIL